MTEILHGMVPVKNKVHIQTLSNLTNSLPYISKLNEQGQMQLAFTKGWIFNGTSAEEMNAMAMDMMSSGLLRFRLTLGQGKDAYTIEAEPRLGEYV